MRNLKTTVECLVGRLEWLGLSRSVLRIGLDLFIMFSSALSYIIPSLVPYG